MENNNQSTIKVYPVSCKEYKVSKNEKGEETKTLLSYEDYFGFFDEDNAIGYMDDLEESYRNCKDVSMTMERVDDYNFLVKYEDSGVQKERMYAISTMDVYY